MRAYTKRKHGTDIKCEMWIELIIVGDRLTKKSARLGCCLELIVGHLGPAEKGRLFGVGEARVHTPDACMQQQKNGDRAGL